MPKSFLIKNCTPKEREFASKRKQALQDFPALSSHGQTETSGVHPKSNANISLGLMEIPHSCNTYSGFCEAPSFTFMPAVSFTSPIHPNGGVPNSNVDETHFPSHAFGQYNNPTYSMEGTNRLGDGPRGFETASPRYTRFMAPTHGRNYASYWKGKDQLRWLPSGQSIVECGKATIPRTMHLENVSNCTPELRCTTPVLQDAEHLRLGPATHLSAEARDHLKRKEKSFKLAKEERREPRATQNIKTHQDHHPYSQGRNDKHCCQLPTLVQRQGVEDGEPSTTTVWYSLNLDGWSSRCSDTNAHSRSHSSVLGQSIDTAHYSTAGGMTTVSQSEGGGGNASSSEAAKGSTSGYRTNSEFVPPQTWAPVTHETPSFTERTEQTPGRAKARHQCDECGQTFTRSSTLTTHKRIHTGEKPYSCEQCGRAFRQLGNLSRHRLTHTTRKPYVCPHCNKAFNRASNLHTHMRTHSDYKPFTCEFCSKRFHQKIDMKIHRHTHTGEKPHKCAKCGRGFKQLTHLTYHLRTHSTERPYKCNICGKGFNQKGNFKAHAYRHTGERPFKCDVCSKGFTLTSTLNTHKRTHAAQKPYQCRVCDKAFYHKNGLKTHYVASHPYTDGVLLL